MRARQALRRLGWIFIMLGGVVLAHLTVLKVRDEGSDILWLIALGFGILVLLGCILLFPGIIVLRDAEHAGARMTQAEFLKAKNDVRTTLLQGLGGALLLFGALATWRQVQATSHQLSISERQQLTERFIRAVDQLGNSSSDVRLGGIVGLGQIANSSSGSADRRSIIRILSGYLHHHATWSGGSESQYQPSSDWLSVTRPDLQAAIDVLAEQNVRVVEPLLLERLDLRRANLQGVNLEKAFFAETHLEGALLEGSNLSEANLAQAYLTGAHLCGASLVNATLDDADLTYAEADRHTQWPTDFDWKAARVIQGNCSS